MTAAIPNGVDTEYFTADASTTATPALIYTGGMNMFANRDAVEWFLEAIWPLRQGRCAGSAFLRDRSATLGQGAGGGGGRFPRRSAWLRR